MHALRTGRALSKASRRTSPALGCTLRLLALGKRSVKTNGANRALQIGSPSALTLAMAGN